MYPQAQAPLPKAWKAWSITRHIQGLNLLVPPYGMVRRAVIFPHGQNSCIAGPPGVHRSKARLGGSYRDPASTGTSFPSMLSLHEGCFSKAFVLLHEHDTNVRWTSLL